MAAWGVSMNAMYVLPLQVTVVATLATVALAMWAGSGGGLRVRAAGRSCSRTV